MTLAAAILGSYLAKREGLKVWREWQRAFTEFRPPTQGVIDGVLVLIGAALLIAPGFVTDIAGLLLLFPVTRRAVAKLVRRAIDRRISDGSIRLHTFDQRARPPGSGEVVETTGESLDERAERARAEQIEARGSRGRAPGEDSGGGGREGGK
jgi:UPF0716 protein FxsA